MVPQALVCRPIPCFSPSLSSQSARLCRPQPTGARHFVRNKDLGHYKLLVHLSSWQRSSNKGIQILGSGGGRIIQGSSGLRFAQACSIWGDSIWVSNSYGEQRKKMPRCASLQVRSVTTPADIETSFDQMIVEMKRKYYMLGGKGGVGKTSCAASLAVKFANSGHPTLIVSTDPAHSLSDSFAQDLSGGNLVAVEGPDSPLFALEINPEQARAEFRASSQNAGGSGVKDFMDSMGLGSLADQNVWRAEAGRKRAGSGWSILGRYCVPKVGTKAWRGKLGELLDTPPPGLDEAIAISKVMQFVQAPEYNKFTRIIFDTAPTGHTLRLLSLPDFLDASIGLKQKLTSATDAIKSVFGQSGESRQTPTDKLEQLKERMAMVRELFRHKESTEFVIVTIPTFVDVALAKCCIEVEPRWH